MFKEQKTIEDWRIQRFNITAHLEAEALERLCASRDHKPSTLNPDECDCGIRRFDD